MDGDQDQENVEAHDDNGEANAEPESDDWRKKLQIALVHATLIVVTVSYAVVGSFVFYSIESPHETDTKAKGVAKIKLLRDDLVESVVNSSKMKAMTKDAWFRMADAKYKNFTENLYSAYKTEFIRYEDLSRIINGSYLNDSDSNMWTGSSAMFFSLTTLATIGYGNVVPHTEYGRIICVFFALFGTPLAIITIGDLGKFTSECIMTAYEKYKNFKERFRTSKYYMALPSLSFLCNRIVLKKTSNVNRRLEGATLAKDGQSCENMLSNINDPDPATVSLNLDENDNGKPVEGSSTSEVIEEDNSSTMNDEDIMFNRVRVPVLLVFGILITYIAFGSIFFHAIEGWDYIDAFYFCFIRYMSLMLLYIGLGLAITTMCIDLVGRQYIWKIHYFGRKFEESDLLNLLKNRKVFQKQLEECQQRLNLPNFEFDTLQQMIVDLSNKIAEKEAAEAFALPQEKVDNEPLPEVVLDDISISTAASYYERILQKYKCNRSLGSPSGPSIDIPCSLKSSPSILEREIMFRILGVRMANEAPHSPSGPDPPLSWNLSPNSSIEERLRLFLNPTSNFYALESPTTFEYEFLHSPDFTELGKLIPRTQRLKSCPAPMFPLITTLTDDDIIKEAGVHKSVCFEQTVTLNGPHYSEELIVPESDEDISPPELISPLSSTESEVSSASGFVDDSSDPTVTYYKGLPVLLAVDKTVECEEVLHNTYNCNTKYFCKFIPPVIVTENHCFVLDAANLDPSSIDDLLVVENTWWKNTSQPVHYYYSPDGSAFHRVQVVILRGEIVKAVLAQPRRSSKKDLPVKSQPAKEFKDVPLNCVYKTCRFYSHWRSCPLFHRILTVMSIVSSENSNLAPNLSSRKSLTVNKTATATTVQAGAERRRVFIQYLWRSKESDKKRVFAEYEAAMSHANQLKRTLGHSSSRHSDVDLLASTSISANVIPGGRDSRSSFESNKSGQLPK